MTDREQQDRVDRIARMLAAAAGLIWDLLDKHPGYQRGYWRERARGVLKSMDAEGVQPG